MRIAVLAGFDEALVDALGAQLKGIAGVELVELSIGATPCEATAPLVDVVLDRASHENAFFRAWVHQAAARGVRVVNPPQRTGPGCGFADLVRAQRAGFRTAQTVLLPAKAYAAHIGASALRNLAFPLDWQGLLDGLGGSAVLLPAVPMTAARGVPVEHVQMLLAAYDQTGTTPTLLQASVHGERVRAWCVRGAQPVLQRMDAEAVPLPDNAPSVAAVDCVAPVAARLLEALDLDFAAVDFCCTDGEALLLAVDAAAPEIDPESMGPGFFAIVVQQLAQRLALGTNAAVPEPKKRSVKKSSGSARGATRTNERQESQGN